MIIAGKSTRRSQETQAADRAFLRKTAGLEEGAGHLERVIGMGVMGLGGLIAIVGGVLFLVIVFKSMWPKK